ncbi:MAG TPA: hypothetical protein VM939_07955 [Gemmatimonadaceae bacterium]|nr:hypothetical protein [Gemmatimonadaceae bacterium]
MRAYTVAAVALTLNTSAKWVDNTLSHYPIPGVVQTRQGISRRLTPQAVIILEIALQISRNLSVPVRRALEIARILEQADGMAQVSVGPFGKLMLDVTSVRHAIGERLAQAVELTPNPRRGRPPGS